MATWATQMRTPAAVLLHPSLFYVGAWEGVWEQEVGLSSFCSTTIGELICAFVSFIHSTNFY